MTANLYSEQAASAPTAVLNPGSRHPFAIINLEGGSWLALRTLSDARAWQDAASSAVDLLQAAADEAAACPECWAPLAGHPAAGEAVAP